LSSWFVDGEGCFYIKTSKIVTGCFYIKTSKIVTGLDSRYKVNVYFYIAQHKRDIALLENLVTYFNCGLIETVETKPTQSSYVVCKFYDIFNKIIPFFDTYPLKGNKLSEFYDFKKK
jgi:hypothetical protein